MSGRKATSREFFSSRWGLLAASLGCAIGVGNIWRFPRLAAEYGGGSFIIIWLIFLFVWSIPLIIAEYTLGRKMRLGLVGTFAKFGEKNRAWMGAFIALVATAVLFYYSVIAGWCFYYFFQSLGGGVAGLESGDAKQFFLDFAANPVNGLSYMIIPLLICGGIIFAKGVHGIEQMNKFMIPSLFVLLIITAGYACAMPGAMRGIGYLLIPKWEQFLNYETWIMALGQSAWSTGAGFGLFLTYAVYVKEEENIVANSILTGIGNNIASIIAALAIIPTIYAFMPPEDAATVLKSGSVGLTFFTLPELFAQMPMGSVIGPLFFLTLIFAALSSMISLMELPTRVLMDFHLPRKKAVVIVVATAIALGFPSAYSLDFLDNQDFVWGQGLIISGFLFAFLIISYGVTRFREQLLDVAKRFRVGGWFDLAIKYVIPVEFALLMLWWFVGAIGEEADWYDIFAVKSLGTCLFQWGLAAFVFYLLNDFMKRKLHASAEPSDHNF